MYYSGTPLRHEAPYHVLVNRVGAAGKHDHRQKGGRNLRNRSCARESSGRPWGELTSERDSDARLSSCMLTLEDSND
jgi:hypothetical protein